MKTNWQPRIKIFADGASLVEMKELNENPLVSGFTTNPSLIRKLGVSDYEDFCRRALEVIPQKPISFEVLSDDAFEIRRQARKIATWGENVFVKIPIRNTRGESLSETIHILAKEGIKLNVTAIMMHEDLLKAIESTIGKQDAILSVFAGRIADTGRNPMALMETSAVRKWKLLWASVREPMNIYQAEECGADIVTVPVPILRKAIDMHDADLDALCQQTVSMFITDAKSSGFRI